MQNISYYYFVSFYYSVQDDYNAIHGGKWTVENLRIFISGTRGKEVWMDFLRSLKFNCFISCQIIDAVASYCVHIVFTRCQLPSLISVQLSMKCQSLIRVLNINKLFVLTATSSLQFAFYRVMIC